MQEYYQTEEGKMKKKRLNQRRYRKKKKAEETDKKPEILDGDEDFLEHMAFVASLTEGREVSPSEVQTFYEQQKKKQRQQGIPFWRKWFKIRDG